MRQQQTGTQFPGRVPTPIAERTWSRPGGEPERSDAASSSSTVLLKMIDDAIMAMRPVPRDGWINNFPPLSRHELRLRLICFAYATGVLDSHEVCQMNAAQGWASGSAGDLLENSSAVTQFRREHRPEIERVLTYILAGVEGTAARGHSAYRVVPPESMHRVRNLLEIACQLDLAE